MEGGMGELGGTHQSDGGVVLSAVVSEGDAVLLHLGEVLLGLLAGAGAQTCDADAGWGGQRQRQEGLEASDLRDQPL